MDVSCSFNGSSHTYLKSAWVVVFEWHISKQCSIQFPIPTLFNTNINSSTLKNFVRSITLHQQTK